MTAPEPTPTAEHIDAVARAWNRSAMMRRGVYENAEALLTSTDPAVHAALLDALVRAGVLTVDLMTLIDGTTTIIISHDADLGGNAWAVAP